MHLYQSIINNNNNVKNIKCDIYWHKYERRIAEETDAGRVNSFNSQNKVKYFLPHKNIYFNNKDVL
jgi:hypothetical protein